MSSVRDMLQREALEEFQAEFTNRVFDMIEDIAAAMLGKDGLIFGDIELERPERIAKTVDDASTGALDELQYVNEPLYRERLSEFLRDSEAEGYGSP